MTTHPRHPENASPARADQARPTPVRIDPSLHLQAAMRLIPAAPHDRQEVARRFLAGTRAAGYDLSNMWGTLDTAHPINGIREVCLAIEGPGRTAMCFVSSPADGNDEDDRDAERARCIRTMVAHLPADRVSLAQALPEPEEPWAIRSYERAGFTHAGELAYMELDLTDKRLSRRAPTFPDGVTVRLVNDPRSADQEHLISALENSYIDTLDCPELCGLRATEDVLESHLSTGQFDPSLWALAFEGGRAIGCSLVSPIPENGSAELVYIGLAPGARGRGLGRALLERSIADLHQRRIDRLVCAVDQRNAPAVKLYSDLGFQAFSMRSAWVHAVPDDTSNVGGSV